MREIIYYSRTAPTSGRYINEIDLYESGRLDIAIHSVIATFFLSDRIRTDSKLHLIFAGPPDPQKHLELKPETEGKTGVDKIYINKKNIAGIIKRMLYKYKEGKKNEVYPGFWIEKKGLLELIKELSGCGKNLYVLDSKGEDIRKSQIAESSVFILGDHKGLPAKELKRLRKACMPVSVGPATYFASQTITILNNEMDRRESKKWH